MHLQPASEHRASPHGAPAPPESKVKVGRVQAPESRVRQGTDFEDRISGSKHLWGQEL